MTKNRKAKIDYYLAGIYTELLTLFHSLEEKDYENSKEVCVNLLRDVKKDMIKYEKT